MSAESEDDLRENLRQMRRSYGDVGLSDDLIPADPISLFKSWLGDASTNPYIVEPNAMVLSTSDLSSRTVLLKDLSGDGFTFFTNYQSRKAKAISSDPRTTLLFPWYAMERQVIIIGEADRVDGDESDQYFASRPYGSQIGAWASAQSEELDSREVLERRVKELEMQYAEGHVPRPPHWGGFRVKPNSIEFWQGRYSRLHDRIRYLRDGDHWKWVRLNP